MSNEKWQRRLEELIAHDQTHGTLPTVKRAENPHKQLATWLANQRSSAVNGTLAEERRRMLDESGLDWKSSIRETFESRLDRLSSLLAIHGELPPQANLEGKDRDLRAWLQRLRKQASAGRLDQEKHKQLDDTYPEWGIRSPKPVESPTKEWMIDQEHVALIQKQEDWLSILVALDIGRRDTMLSKHSWFVDFTLHQIEEPPCRQAVSDLETHLGRTLDIPIGFPITTHATPQSVGVIKQQDIAWIEHALALASYFARLGRFPKQVGNRKQYRERFDVERQRPVPRVEILIQEMGDKEISLRHWLTYQQEQDVKALLREDRALYLDAVIPQWRHRTRRRTFQESSLMLAKFVTDSRRWPSQGSSLGSDEWYLAGAIKMWRLAERKGTFGDERSRAMTKLFGSTWTLAGVRPSIPDQQLMLALEKVR